MQGNPPPSAAMQREIDPSYTGIHIFTMGGNNTSAPVPAGQRPPTNRLPPLPPFCFSLHLKGKVFWQAMDPYGCQILHQKLEARKPEDIQMIFSEVKDQICLLMFDRLGSYVIQKLFEVCDEEQMTQLVSSVTADIRFLKVVCVNSQGSESMKKFLKCLVTPKQISDMMSVFQQLTLPLLNHHIGYDVIAHCFDVFPIPAEETKPILDVIADNFWEIATNPSGSCLLRQILVSEVFLLKSLPIILSAIIVNAYQLSQDPFGHQVVEHVIQFGTQDVVRDIVDKLRRDFADLSMDKYARAVVIALMMKYNETYAPQIMDDLIISPRFWIAHLQPFVNFVPRCAEEYSMGTLSEAFNYMYFSHTDHQQSHHNGKNVLPGKKRRDSNRQQSHHNGKNVLPGKKRRKKRRDSDRQQSHHNGKNSDRQQSHHNGNNVLPGKERRKKRRDSDRQQSHHNGKNVLPGKKRRDRV